MRRGIFSALLALAFAAASPAYAQRGKTSSSASDAPFRHLQTIVGAGVAGAVLGLSTLSFYGRPQEKLGHIAGGAAVGIIIGAAFTTFKAATEPRDFYGENPEGARAESWELATASRDAFVRDVPAASFTFEF